MASSLLGSSPPSVMDDVDSAFDEATLLNTYVDEATDKLLLREFDACTKICRKIVSLAKGGCSASCIGTDEYLEKAAVLAIQAYAELNKWQTVVPYVQNVFGSIEACPPSVIQLCLLLHARVREFMQCHAIAKVWLGQRPRAGQEMGYAEVAKVYVHHVLVPLGAYNLIPQFVEGCPGLTDEEKGELLTPTLSKPSTPVSSRRRFSFSRQSSVQSSDTPLQQQEQERSAGTLVPAPRPERLDALSKNEGWKWPIIKDKVRHLLQWILSIPMMGVSKVLVAAAITVAAFLQIQKGDGFLDLNRVVAAWHLLGKLWRSLFGPYRSLRTAD